MKSLIGSKEINPTTGGNVTEDPREKNERLWMEATEKQKTEAPVDKNGFTMKPPITDTQCILMCLRNAPCGADKKQVQKLIDYYSCD